MTMSCLQGWTSKGDPPASPLCSCLRLCPLLAPFPSTLFAVAARPNLLSSSGLGAKFVQCVRGRAAGWAVSLFASLLDPAVLHAGSVGIAGAEYANSSHAAGVLAVVKLLHLPEVGGGAMRAL